jgi:hypothetical protein
MRPSKEAGMVGSTLGVYSYRLIFVSARTNIRHHHLCTWMSCAERNRSRPREEIIVPIVFALAATTTKSPKTITRNCCRLNRSADLEISLPFLNGFLKPTALNSQLTKRTSRGELFSFKNSGLTKRASEAKPQEPFVFLVSFFSGIMDC